MYLITWITTHLPTSEGWMAELAKARSRVGKFLPVSGKKLVFSAVKTGLAKKYFASKNSSCQNFSYCQLEVCHLVHNIFLITCYLFNCWHRIVILLLCTAEVVASTLVERTPKAEINHKFNCKTEITSLLLSSKYIWVLAWMRQWWVTFILRQCDSFMTVVKSEWAY